MASTDVASAMVLHPQHEGPMADGCLRAPDLPDGAGLPQISELMARRAAGDADLVVQARKNPNKFIEAVGRIEGQKWIGKQAGAHAMWQDHLSHSGAVPGATTAVLEAPISHGKALPTDTPIAVPGGWCPIGTLVVGDAVLAGDGQPAIVTSTSEVWTDHDVFEFEFDDGSSLRSDADHLWLAWTVHDRAGGREPQIVTTAEILDNFRTRRGQLNWSIPLAGPAERPPRALPVDPYVFGAWLGDGTATTSQVTCHEHDAEIVDRCIAIEGGYCGARTFKPGTRTFMQTVGALPHKRRAPNYLRGRLRSLGVLGNKHIPAEYLIASIEQRRALLAGLMDTDGTVGRLDGRLSFSNTNERLARNVLVLVRSLGFKASIVMGPAVLHGRRCGTHYRVCWTCNTPVFWLRRKADKHAALARERVDKEQARIAARAPRRGRARIVRRRQEAKKIVAWRQVERVPVCCISIGAADATYIATDQYIRTHNSLQAHRWRVTWELGNNPNLRVLLLSATSQLPEKMLSGIKADIEHNPFVQAVFPHLRPGRKAGQQSWSGSTIHVDRADNLNDPSIECAGLSSKILGSRKDLIVVDDVLNTENTLTPYMRKQVWDRIQAEALSRRPPHLSSRAWFLGHPWTEDDALAQACQQPGARVLRCGARVQRNSKGRIITSADEAEWNEIAPWWPLLPELWTKLALQQRIAELAYAARFMIDCRFMRRGSMGFSPEGLALALMNGRGQRFLDHWNPIATGCPTYTGVDLSTGEAEDETVIFTAAVIQGRRRVLEIQAGKWTGPQIMERIHDVYSRYKSTIAVESNGAQKFLRQFIGDDSTHITPVLDHHTGTNKHALKWGIKAMEMELAPPGKWVFPRPRDMHEPITPELRSLINGAINYSNDGKHTSDYVMAWWICWLAMAKDEGVSLK